MFYNIEFKLLDFNEKDLEDLYYKALYRILGKNLLILFAVLAFIAVMRICGIKSLLHVFFFIMLFFIVLVLGIMILPAYFMIKRDFKIMRESIYATELFPINLTLTELGELNILINTDLGIPISYPCFLLRDFEIVYGDGEHGNEIDIMNKKIYFIEKSPEIFLDDLPVDVHLFKIENIDKDLLLLRCKKDYRKYNIVLLLCLLLFIPSLFFDFSFNSILIFLFILLLIYLLSKQTLTSLKKEIELLTSNDLLPIRINCDESITYVLSPTNSIKSDLFRKVQIDIDESAKDNIFDVLNSRLVINYLI